MKPHLSSWFEPQGLEIRQGIPGQLPTHRWSPVVWWSSVGGFLLYYPKPVTNWKSLAKKGMLGQVNCHTECAIASILEAMNQ